MTFLKLAISQWCWKWIKMLKKNILISWSHDSDIIAMSRRVHPFNVSSGNTSVVGVIEHTSKCCSCQIDEDVFPNGIVFCLCARVFWSRSALSPQGHRSSGFKLVFSTSLSVCVCVCVCMRVWCALVYICTCKCKDCLKAWAVIAGIPRAVCVYAEQIEAISSLQNHAPSESSFKSEIGGDFYTDLTDHLFGTLVWVEAVSGEYGKRKWSLCFSLSILECWYVPKKI